MRLRNPQRSRDPNSSREFLADVMFSPSTARNGYGYDLFGKVTAMNASGTNCSTGGQCIIYDALGRDVEIDSGSTNREIWYTQLGKTAYMTGATYNYSYWPGPGGSTLLDENDGYQIFHKDWLNNARISSNVIGQNFVTDQSFAPFGETYNTFGSTAANETMFTGDTQDILSTFICCYDTPNRELSAVQGRWLWPDPAGLNAVDPANPQSWNRYAYVLSFPSFLRLTLTASIALI